jgi:hypothetical protein
VRLGAAIDIADVTVQMNDRHLVARTPKRRRAIRPHMGHGSLGSYLLVLVRELD